ncbi:MAG: sugar transferase [Candidatus Acidiferrales bacterium]
MKTGNLVSEPEASRFRYDTMIRFFSTYFPKRTLFLVLCQTLLVFGLLSTIIFIHLGTHLAAVFRNGHEILRVMIFGLICLSCLYYQDVRIFRSISKPGPMLIRLIQALGIASILLALLYAAFPTIELASAIVAIWLVGMIWAISHHVFLRLNESRRWSRSALVIGDGPLAKELVKVINSRSELGLTLVGYLGQPSHSSGIDLPCLGPVEGLAQVVKEREVQRVIVAMSDGRAKLPVDSLLDLKTAGVAVQEGAEFYESATGRIPVDTVRPSWLIFGPGFRISKVQSFYKRLVSLSISFIGVIVLSPLMLVIALAIWVDSPGPIIFRQVRIGMHGLPFTLYKFRTMYHEADHGRDPLPVQANDRRITRVGRWLRQFRFDEFPQLFNILIGHMALVGPRPFVSNQEFELVEQIPLYKQRWSVRPGATGWAQVQRGYCATLQDNVEKLAYDLFYIKNMSIGLDLLILLKTFKIVLAGIGGR